MKKYHLQNGTEYIPQFGDTVKSSHKEYTIVSMPSEDSMDDKIILVADGILNRENYDTFIENFEISGVACNSFLKMIADFPERKVDASFDGSSLTKFMVDGFQYEFNNKHHRSFEQFLLRVAICEKLLKE